MNSQQRIRLESQAIGRELSPLINLLCILLVVVPRAVWAVLRKDWVMVALMSLAGVAGATATVIWRA